MRLKVSKSTITLLSIILFIFFLLYTAHTTLLRQHNNHINTDNYKGQENKFRFDEDIHNCLEHYYYNSKTNNCAPLSEEMKSF